MELFTVHLPRSPEVPIVANLPHSGLFLPDLVTEQLLPEFAQALPHTDWHLDQLYRSLPDLGITLFTQIQQAFEAIFAAIVRDLCLCSVVLP